MISDMDSVTALLCIAIIFLLWRSHTDDPPLP